MWMILPFKSENKVTLMLQQKNNKRKGQRKKFRKKTHVGMAFSLLKLYNGTKTKMGGTKYALWLWCGYWRYNRKDCPV